MKLRIVSDGVTSTVFDEHGNDISKLVYAIEWKHTTGKDPEALVTFRAAALDVIAEARVNVEAIVEAESLGKR